MASCGLGPVSALIPRTAQTRAADTSDKPSRRKRKVRNWDIDLALVRREKSDSRSAIRLQAVRLFAKMCSVVGPPTNQNRMDSLPNPRNRSSKHESRRIPSFEMGRNTRGRFCPGELGIGLCRSYLSRLFETEFLDH